ncbi:hypothetical protein TNCV_1930301 [Trichonephila clavipes]|nr:hypothetical protein TNCV_1930301 [Trichonephila clavipes]
MLGYTFSFSADSTALNFWPPLISQRFQKGCGGEMGSLEAVKEAITHRRRFALSRTFSTPIIVHGQGTTTTEELAPSSSNYHTTQNGDDFELLRLNVYWPLYTMNLQWDLGLNS